MPADYTQDSPIFGTHSAVSGAYYADTFRPSGVLDLSYTTVRQDDAAQTPGFSLDDPLHPAEAPLGNQTTRQDPVAAKDEPHCTSPHPSLGGGMVSLVAGTRIETLMGETLVEDLTPDDLIVTRDHGVQNLHWIGQTKITVAPGDAPIFISKGTFGLPRDMTLHPQQAILLEDARAQKFLGKDGAMVRAADLLNHVGVSRLDVSKVTYVHLLIDAEQVVRADGVWAESLYPDEDRLPLQDADVAQDMVEFVTISAAFDTDFETYESSVLAA